MRNYLETGPDSTTGIRVGHDNGHDARKLFDLLLSRFSLEFHLFVSFNGGYYLNNKCGICLFL